MKLEVILKWQEMVARWYRAEIEISRTDLVVSLLQALAADDTVQR